MQQRIKYHIEDNDDEVVITIERPKGCDSTLLIACTVADIDEEQQSYCSSVIGNIEVDSESASTDPDSHFGLHSHLAKTIIAPLIRSLAISGKLSVEQLYDEVKGLLSQHKVIGRDEHWLPPE